MIFGQLMELDGFSWVSNFTLWGSTPLLLTAPEAEANSALVLAGVLLSLVVIYFASKVGGEISNRFGLPPVLGELVGGVIVGVSALHLLVFPEGGADATSSLIMNFLQTTAGLAPEEVAPTFAAQSEVISVLAELGVVILLFEIGLESNLKELMAVGIQAAVVACVGVAVPFGAGTAGLMIWFGVPAVPAIFAGAALTATSIGITSKVLSELGTLNSREGQIILGAAVIDDVLGIIVLAVVASLAKTGEVDVGNVIYLIISATGFLLGAILLGNVFNKTFVTVVDRLKTRGELVIPAFIFAFVMSYLAAAIHLEAILGAFAAGLVLDETDKRKELQKQVVPIADMLVPIFFVTVGAKTDLGVLNPAVPSNREGLIIAIFLIAVAIVGKVVTGAAVFGQPGINRLAIGVGMIPRGEVGLVFAGVGSASGVLSKPLEAAIIMMVILTTFLAPPLLRFVFPPTTAVGGEPETPV
ncbi:MAG: High-affinity Na(+)/H(+) antiporter NhaS3 [Chroococcidiopsis cubana SAG 39.79]|jgi:Kef-type K+ transport system membrane component KefB|uniref:Sodium:proton antiporter n=2 Tax=Chroococcidiopsis TaxID=54298 RepID=A0AB37UI68_9CYAN|nr:cation:proton antiporter [Chroococcidiopsis cubana]MDZ4873434.1 High-affinity Na(+)/H(+) antiporter NhaS3 [Chroococcidiopsis cubana SAG 39.79]PSB43437.1 sodium:proton antiporter [Cyanosarcina cf. burmensis CCALA 770]PSB64375.1 sodium:proton antiporter [Chroococcidiopsis cubana CCALA 043]RUT11079.1 sodium:proton antiporter [Chroococcidiopsis cubana SAG 39.79]